MTAAPAARAAGRDPRRSADSSAIGVTARNQASNAGSSHTSDRYAARAASAISSIVARPSAVAAATAASRSAVEASRTELAISSSSRSATAGSANFAASTSPCSVSLSRPSMEPGACARIARWVGPPPRPIDPPRPWKSVSSTPWRRAAATRRSWAVYSSHPAATYPDSLFESE